MGWGVVWWGGGKGVGVWWGGEGGGVVPCHEAAAGAEGHIEGP